MASSSSSKQLATRLLPGLWLPSVAPRRGMTRSRRVQDRSRLKRVQKLEIVTERCKVASKVLAIVDALKAEPERVTPLKRLEILRPQLNIKKPHKVADFVRKSPKLFEVCRDSRGVLWCGLSESAEELVDEEARLIEENATTAAEKVTRMVMMSADRRLRLDKVAHFRRAFGLPTDFRARWVHEFPELFKVVTLDDGEHIELVSWNPAWAVTEMEKNVSAGAVSAPAGHPPGELRLAFPVKFPPEFKKVFRVGGRIENFQKRPYLSPYANAQATALTPGSEEFDKRAVAVMHEILSLTMEKQLVTDHLTHFRREYMMPQKLMRLLLKHFGIFYVSQRGKRVSVFLTEAYDGAELIDKCPLVLWKEKVLKLTGYRGRMKKIWQRSDHESDVSEDDLFDGDGVMDDDDAAVATGVTRDDDDESEMDVAGLGDEFRS